MFEQGSAPVRLLVVSPVFGYPGFLPEALDGLLSSKGAPEHRIILADDGCAFAETYEICMEAQTAHPEKVLYRRSAKNSGLAAARNGAVKYGLDRWPSLECIIFLDADDRVTSNFLARSYETFHASRKQLAAQGNKLGWVFEDPIFFGDIGEMVRLREDSPLWNLVGATHTSSSVMSADIFRQGHYYEESMKAGSEDWEFWLRARDAGFSGAYRPDLGFTYRRCPGSMSAGVSRRMEGNRALIRLRNKAQYRATSVSEKFCTEASPAVLIDEFGTVSALDAHSSRVNERIKSIPDLARHLAQSAGVAATALPPFVFFAEKSTFDFVTRSGLTPNILEFATAHRNTTPVLKHVFRWGQGNSALPGQSGIGKLGKVNGDFPQIISVTDRAIMSKIAIWESGKQILDLMKQVNWSLQSDTEMPRNLGAVTIFNQQFDNIVTEFKLASPNSRRAKWRPQGLFHSDVPQYLTGIKNFVPINFPANSSLIVFDVEAMGTAQAQMELKRLIKREQDADQIVYGICDEHEPIGWIEAAFENVIQIPMIDTALGKVAKDEGRLLSYSLNFSRVIALNLFAHNDGAKILKQNGIPCELALTRSVAGHVVFRGLFEAFKAYSSVALDGSDALFELVETSGVAREKTQTF